MLAFSFSFTYLLLPYKIVMGGLTGVASIIYFVSKIPIDYTFFSINIILLLVALKMLGWRFLAKTIYATFAMSYFLHLAFQLVPKDALGEPLKLLGEGNDFMAVMLSCAISGAMLAIVFEHNGSTGGSDIVAACINKYYNVSLGRVLQVVDFCIIASSFFVFQGEGGFFALSKVVFGLCTMIVETITLDYVYNARRQSVQFLIFTKKHEEIAEAIATKIVTGVTFLDGHGWYTGQDIKVICTLTRKHNSTNVFRIIKEIDPNAFVSQSAVIGVYGEGFDQIKVKVRKHYQELEQQQKDNEDSIRHQQRP